MMMSKQLTQDSRSLVTIFNTGFVSQIQYANGCDAVAVFESYLVEPTEYALAQDEFLFNDEPAADAVAGTKELCRFVAHLQSGGYRITF